jgi:DNA-binding transcriptional LysR family regulator
MDLWQLRIFCRVVELKSFSKTAESIHLSQPTVSSHIKDLEGYYECRLIDRLAREAVPTKAGEILYNYASKIISLAEQAKNAVSEYKGTIKGRLIVGGSTIPGGYLLPTLIGKFIQQYPEVRITLTHGDTRSIIDDVLDGRVEFGVVGALSQEPHLFQEPLFEDEMALIVPSGHPWAVRNTVTLEELSKEPFIVRETGSGTLRTIREMIGEKRYRIEDFHLVAEMGSTAAVVQGIRGGAGVSILSKVAVAESLSVGSLASVGVEGLTLKRWFYLTRHSDRTPSPLCLRFIDFLKKPQSP